MAKIGRNEMCPCGSGLKFKKCCMIKGADRDLAGPPVKEPRTLRGEIEKIQQAALDGKTTVRDFGVFVFLATGAGDAWLLEVSEGDALHLAVGREKIDFELDEKPETLEVNWSHTFVLKNKRFEVKAYKDGRLQVLEDYPVHAIAAAVKRIRKKFSARQLNQVHVEADR